MKVKNISKGNICIIVKPIKVFPQNIMYDTNGRGNEPDAALLLIQCEEARVNAAINCLGAQDELDRHSIHSEREPWTTFRNSTCQGDLVSGWERAESK